MYWILKTEPNAYSYDDLEKDTITSWDGVRNYQARNNLRSMKKGELAMIYHSVGPREIVGIASIEGSSYPDKTANKGDFVAVDIKANRRLNKPVKLAQIKANEKLKNMSLVKQSRLSVCPVTKDEWQELIKMSE